MPTIRTPRERWVDEGAKVLADGGPDAIRVEVLAKRIGVTKGGFYGHFSDRQALLEAILDRWERTSVDDVLAQVADEGGDLRSRAHRAGQLTFSAEQLPVDLAVREWARRDPVVAERLRRVDDRRMDLLREMFATFCDDPVEVEARSLIAFCVAIGNHFLAADHGGRSRAAVMARAADLILKR
jgi:AcrR family transcriptional regulator